MEKTASGSRKVTIARKEWEAIGIKSGWMKTAGWQNAKTEEGKTLQTYLNSFKGKYLAPDNNIDRLMADLVTAVDNQASQMASLQQPAQAPQAQAPAGAAQPVGQ